MSVIVNESLDAKLAERLKVERETRRWSIGDLADRSGVSKAMISKVERGEASPTAALLGRLSAAFGLTLSTLLARAEGARKRLARASEQATWVDPETGFKRRAISPPGSPVLEVVHGELPPGARIDYPASAYTFIDQQLWILKGTLHFTEGAITHELHVGDCLELGPPAECTFENRARTPCLYLVVIARHQAS